MSFGLEKMHEAHHIHPNMLENNAENSQGRAPKGCSFS